MTNPRATDPVSPIPDRVPAGAGWSPGTLYFDAKWWEMWRAHPGSDGRVVGWFMEPRSATPATDPPCRDEEGSPR